MKRICLIITIAVLYTQLSEAQLWTLKRLELTAGLGTSSFFGDVGGFSHGQNWAGLKDITFLQTRFNVNLNAKYRITRDLNARASFTFARMHATDERGSNESRGYESVISLLEPALMAEYYFVRNSAENSYLFNKGRGEGIIGILRSLDFYAYGGVGAASFSVKPNEPLALRGLPTKGFTPVIPVGVGGSLSAYPNVNLGFEFGFRYTFSDDIDGYTSQYSSANDVYYFFNLTITYKLKLIRGILPSFR